MNLLVSMMTSAVMWRGKMTEYNVFEGEDSVSICKDKRMGMERIKWF